ncbi:hypothetical protein Clacol_006717 [Clathrus columnatus]|uniref:Uncharacterized protein n=1 Tax=Clathrus columnatus TaxID=1419009 RepID=A0AAV5AKL3_9AGAM|nr:hypothetical protein Clacol_006717 [Clathrus columnatus]
MKFLVVAASLLAPTFVAGQLYGGPVVVNSPAPTPTAAPGQHIITVAENNGLMFTPGSVTANVNENVTFLFSTHCPVYYIGSDLFRIVKAPSTTRCPKAPSTHHVPNSRAGLTPASKLQAKNLPLLLLMQVNQTVPVKHCGMGMVGAINPPTSGSDTIGAYSSAALSVGNNEATQTGSLELLGVGASAAAAPTAQPGVSGAERLWIGVGTLFCASLGVFATLL